MPRIQTALIGVTITVNGVERECEATVRYVYTPAERGLRERGSGLQLEPDWRENAEILTVIVDKIDISWLFSSKQTDAIQDELLGE